MLYEVRNYEGSLENNHEELIDNGDGSFELVKESKKIQFFHIDELPKNLMDKDLIEIFINYRNNSNRIK